MAPMGIDGHRSQGVDPWRMESARSLQKADDVPGESEMIRTSESLQSEGLERLLPRCSSFGMSFNAPDPRGKQVSRRDPAAPLLDAGGQELRIPHTPVRRHVYQAGGTFEGFAGAEPSPRPFCRVLLDYATAPGRPAPGATGSFDQNRRVHR